MYELTRCPVCDAGDAAEIASGDAIRLELERLWLFHGNRLQHPVPPRHLTDRLVFTQQPPLRLVQCPVCSHLYRNPRETPETVRDGYEEEDLSDDVMRKLFEQQADQYRAQLGRLKSLAQHIQNGLEVGSYVGAFLAASRDAGLSFVGLDIGDATARFAAARGLRVINSSIDAHEGTSKYDVIAIWNTFEQLTNQRDALVAARRLLRPQGILALRIPNAGYYLRWRARLRGGLGGLAERLLAHNNLLGFPYREGFTQRSLFILLDRAKFDIVRVHGDTLPRTADRWTSRQGALEELLLKSAERLLQREWEAPWVEVYARRRETAA
jgi:2-polyprenyl-3-methyl-5-hydroxy-6-metoxy-1,4-benzoquinol methylase